MDNTYIWFAWVEKTTGKNIDEINTSTLRFLEYLDSYILWENENGISIFSQIHNKKKNNF